MQKGFLLLATIVCAICCNFHARMGVRGIEVSELYEAVERGGSDKVQQIVDAIRSGASHIGKPDKIAVLNKARQLRKKLNGLLTNFGEKFSVEDLASLGISISNITEKNIRDAAGRLQKIILSIESMK